MATTPPNTPQPPCPEALFRFYLLSQVRGQEQAGSTRAEAVAAVAAQRHSGFARAKVSARTLYRWLAAFDANGDFNALVPAQRARREDSQALPKALLAALSEEKRADPAASVPELIRRAREQGLLGLEQRVDRTTVWRHLRRQGLTTARAKRAKDGDCRRFSYAHRMDMAPSAFAGSVCSTSTMPLASDSRWSSAPGRAPRCSCAVCISASWPMAA